MALIYMSTPTAQSVLANGIIPLTTIQRRKGCAIQQNGNSIVLNKVGYYKISGTITFSVPVAGAVSVSLLKNSSEIISANTGLTAALTTTYTLPIDAIVRVYCSEAPVFINLLNDGVAIDTSNVSLIVESVE